MNSATPPAPAPTIGRLAPSPTGYLHLGHAQSFLVAYWSLRSQGGQLLVRLEDVDVSRATEEHADLALTDLEWLGIDWDGTPRLQSDGLTELTRGARSLLERGLAYPCVCSRGDLRGAPQGTSGEVCYPGTCRGLYQTLEEAQAKSGTAAGLRFQTTPGVTGFEDALFGPQAFDVSQDSGDFLILRRDGTPAYQLAVVLDDARDGVTEVVRGSDLLPSTARQIQLQRALGLPTPRYLHVPLVTDHTGRRLAKREADLSLVELREAGVDPREVVQWIAKGMGLLPKEHDQWLTAAAALAHYDARLLSKAEVRLPEGGPVFRSARP